MILATGATGKVGRRVVAGLIEEEAEVQALVRDPDAAVLPEGVETIRGDLSDPDGLTEQLNDVEAVFLLWPFFTAEGANELANVLAGHAPRVRRQHPDMGGSDPRVRSRALAIWSGGPLADPRARHRRHCRSRSHRRRAQWCPLRLERARGADPDRAATCDWRGDRSSAALGGDLPRGGRRSARRRGTRHCPRHLGELRREA